MKCESALAGSVARWPKAMGAPAAAGRKRRGFKEGGLAYGEVTARGPVNSAALPSRVHGFLTSEPFVLTCRVGRWEMVVWLTIVSYPSPSAQVDVAPSTGGVDPDIRGIKKDTEPSGALRRTTFCRVSRSGACMG